MTEKFHRTAITRKNFSKPVRYLLKNGMLYGGILDYGCGRGYDVEMLAAKGFMVNGYDPNGEYSERYPLKQKYDFVICNFVLNVVEDLLERLSIEESIIGRLHDGGTAYITVRNDKANLKGKTSTGTWQGVVAPCKLGWLEVTKNSSFIMWKYTK